MKEPKPVLQDDVLYLGDNGRCYHGRCAGATARFTGRDLSGCKVERVPDLLARRYGIECEACAAKARRAS